MGKNKASDKDKSDDTKPAKGKGKQAPPRPEADEKPKKGKGGKPAKAADEKPAKGKGKAAKAEETKPEAEETTEPKKGKGKGKAAKADAPAEGGDDKPKAKRGGTHPKHPSCPECSKSMYKSMTKGKPVKTTDPWAFCRNEKCSLYGKDQTGAAPADDGDETKPAATDEKPAKGKGKAPKGKAAKDEAATEAAETKPAAEPKKGKGKQPVKAAEPVADEDDEGDSPDEDEDDSDDEDEDDDDSEDSEDDSDEDDSDDEDEDDGEGDDDGDEESKFTPMFDKARTRIGKAIKDKNPIAESIASLALGMVMKSDGVKGVKALIKEFKLDSLYSLNVEKVQAAGKAAKAS